MSSASPYPLAMFPLEQVVLPGTAVPLHIFEPRYRVLARELRDATDPELAFAPITRGREVGGEDQRADVAVAASVMRIEEFPDGRWAMVAAATRRLRVRRWLPDDPYPRAEVVDWPDGAGPELDPKVDDLLEAFARLAEAIVRIDPRHDLRTARFDDDDPARRIWKIISAAHLGTLDMLTLLESPDPVSRAEEAVRLIAERTDLLTALADRDR